MTEPRLSPRPQSLHDRIEGFSGEWHTGEMMRKLYATDASAYQEMPRAVAIPRSEQDLHLLIQFANEEGHPLIPRAAGTSLAGQVVGDGIVVDISQHFTDILEINEEEGWARVQPGVIRNELNMALAPKGLFFGPETSTQNRAMMGGMLGNNSCGSNSVRFGSTRDHVLEIRGLLSDGSEVVFRDLTSDEFEAKCEGDPDSLETKLYRDIRALLGDAETRARIRKSYPDPSIPRRNTGYALDLLMDCAVFGESDKPFNFCKLIAGAEGTLLFVTEIKVRTLPLPPKNSALLCAHFESVDASLRANLLALPYQPYACELIDRYILECTKANIEQRRNRFFVKGEPEAILVVELRESSESRLAEQMERLVAELQAAGLGYHFPVLRGEDTNRIWDLRKAGLGVLSVMPGDAKPVPVIEDTAVKVDDLPAYIRELNTSLSRKFGVELVHYAHAGSGELHVRPIVDLKKEEGNRIYRGVAEETARIVKKYRGSLSGEHGDGRLRGEFIRFMVGRETYALLERVKHTWDPGNLFNPGKIVHTPPMHTSLRYTPGQPARDIRTVFDFSATRGILRAAELCNGSGDCRKTHLSGGTMCPSYMATRNEKDTTRARANILRQILTASDASNPFDSAEIHEVMDLCLSCKGCKSECPSNVDVAKLKAEFLQHFYDARGIPLRTRMIAGFTFSSRLASRVPWLWNGLFGTEPVRRILNRIVGFAPDRSIPKVHGMTLEKWYRRRRNGPNRPVRSRVVYLFNDEFTNYNDPTIGRAAVELLEALGYEVRIPRHLESGRVYLSKGLVRKARAIAIRNVNLLKDRISEDSPLVGIEPSAILGFRDEYPELVPEELRAEARRLAGNCLQFDEFFMREVDAGNITRDRFQSRQQEIRLHGHCHQKALASIVPTKQMLAFPEGHSVRLIPSGCCGMAGSFGYEKEHYKLSMDIGELVLFPAVRSLPHSTLVAAPGTSCRHQIHDGTGRHALHPIQILRQALPPGNPASTV